MRIRILVLSAVLSLVSSNVFGVIFKMNKTGTGSGHIRVNGVDQTLPFSGSYTSGTSLVIEAVPDDGSRFVDWSGNAQTFTDNPHTFNVPTFQITYYANFELLPRTFTMNKGGTGIGHIRVDGVDQTLPFSASYTPGTSIVIEAVPGDDFSYFDGWTGISFSSHENPHTFQMPANNTSYTANFGRVTLTINQGGTGSGGIYIASTNGTVHYDLPYSAYRKLYDTPAVVAVPDGGSVFAGWSGDINSSDPSIMVPMDSDKNLIATFNKMSFYAFTMDKLHGNGHIIVNGVDKTLPFSADYVAGTLLVIEAVPDAGFHVDEWDWDAHFYCRDNICTFTMPAKNISYNVSFGFMMTFNRGGTGPGRVIVSHNNVETYLEIPGTIIQKPNDRISVRAQPLDGSVFAGWSGAVSSSDLTIEVIMGSDKTLVASFNLPQIATHTLTITKSGSGSGQVKINNILFGLPHTEQVADGSQLSIEAVPAPGSVFVGWSGVVNSANQSINVTLNSDKNLAAAFNRSQTQTKTLNITQSGLGTGWVKVNSILRRLPYTEQAASGTAFALEAVPTAFSLFPGWTGAATSTDPVINLTLNADKSLNAVFDLAPPYPNMLKNGEFSDGANNWYFSVWPPAEAVGNVQNGEYSMACTNGGTASWQIQLIQYGLLIENGCTYHVLYDAYAAAGRFLGPYVGRNSEPWTTYSGWREDTLSTTRRRYDYSFEMTNPADPDGRLLFDFGLSATGLHLDNVVLIKETGNDATVTFTVQVPAGTPSADKIYLAGNFNFWDPGPSQNGSDGLNHDLPMQKVSSRAWRIALPFNAGAQIEYKYTRGSWSLVETGPSGQNIDNRKYTVPSGLSQKIDNLTGWADYSSVDSVAVTSINDFQLMANYPNPFNAGTTISYKLDRQGVAVITIYDISGHELVALPQGIQPAGEHDVRWDAGTFPTGVYFYRLTATGAEGRSRQLIKKLMLMK